MISLLSRALKTRHSLLPLSLGAIAFSGACGCEDDLYALPGSVAGSVCSVETGAPLAEHTVTLETRDGVLEAKTDAFGQYEVDQVAAGPVTVTAEVDGQVRTWETSVGSGDSVKLTDEECREPPPPPPAPAGSVSGCVCDDDDGEWVQGANVFVVTSDGDVVVTGTDAEGCFSLDGVPLGNHVLKIEKGSFYREHDVVVTEGADFPIETPASCELPPPPPVGTVTGRVCAPDGSTWLAGASVRIELDDGSVVEATSGAEGHWELQGVPAGTHVVTVVVGSFVSDYEVTVPEDGSVAIPEEECQIELNASIAVVDGIWDDVKSVLLNVGIDPANITEFTNGWASQLLLNYDELAEFDIVFLNCGLSETDYLGSADAAIMQANLRQFVDNGGSVYSSDQAYDIVEQAFPEYIDFYGDDAEPQSAQKGASQDSILGSVVDLGLATALGSNTLDLHYPLGAWSVMEEVAPQVRVYIRANAKVSTGLISTTTLSNVPHTVSFPSGEGKVVYTSFHQEPGINQEMERVLQLLVFEL